MTAAAVANAGAVNPGAGGVLQPTPERKEKAFTAAIDIVKLFTTFSIGALGFAIGLTTQSSIFYPGWSKSVIFIDWLVLFAAVALGWWGQGLAPTMLRRGTADSNDGAVRGVGAVLVLLFGLGVVGLGVILFQVTRFGAAGEQLAVDSPTAAVRAALETASGLAVTKVATTEYLKGVDAANPEQGSWHVQFETEAKASTRSRTGKKPDTVTHDVYVDPRTGCAFMVQPAPRYASTGCPAAGTAK